MYPGRPIQYDVSLSELDIAKCKLAVLNPNTCPTIVKRCDVLLGLNNCVPGKLNRGQVATAHCCNKDYVSSVAKSFNEGGIGEL
ncbi:MAG: hypothetical protein IJS50_00575, partial [Desulfovibrio sp.]|nr:hypothetical protein [Desulfovibrio sp.]